MNLMPIIDTAAVLVSLFFLVVGSISDLKTREVDDKVWLFYGPLGVVLTAVRVVLDPSLFVLVGISFAIVFIISMGLFYLGLTGGADAKAIICLGLTLPLPPSSWHPLIGFVHPFFPLVVVIMSFISSGSMALWFCVRNTVSYARLKAECSVDSSMKVCQERRLHLLQVTRPELLTYNPRSTCTHSKE